MQHAMQHEDMMRLRLQCLNIAQGNINHANQLVDFVMQEQTPTLKPDDNTFSSALYHLKNGFAVSRAGWNGKGMFVYLVGANSYPAQTGVAKAYFGEKAKVPYGAYLAMKTVDGTVVPWLASQTDIMADDWSIVLPESNGETK